MPYSLAFERMYETAVFALSYITSPKLPVSSILPVQSRTDTSIGSIVPPTLVHARPFTVPT